MDTHPICIFPKLVYVSHSMLEIFEMDVVRAFIHIVDGYAFGCKLDFDFSF